MITGQNSFNSNNCEFVAFLDDCNPLEFGIWKARKAYDGFMDPCRNAKIHKILSTTYFPESDFTIWMDGNTFAIRNPEELIQKFLIDTESDIAVFEHPKRKTIYEELDRCVGQKKDNRDILHEQYNRYKRHYGDYCGHRLPWCKIILRRNNFFVHQFETLWWAEICRFSRRDQPSFPIAHELIGYNSIRVNFIQNPKQEFGKYFRQVGD